MEVYFRELISEEASLEKLVSDLERIVQGADDFAKAIGVDITAYPRTEVALRLQRLKDRCRQLNHQIAAKARATNKLVHEKPYTFVAGALLLGIVAGIGLKLKK